MGAFIMSLLHDLTQSGRLWSANDWRMARIHAAPSGYAPLDAELPGGGWPLGAVTEILYARPGQGELRLLLPYLASLSQTDQRWQVWFNPPHQPHAPGLAHWGMNLSRLLLCQAPRQEDLLWSLERCLTTGGCQAVVAWLDRLDSAHMRRLQLAAESNRLSVFLLRPERWRDRASSADLRLQVSAEQADQLRLNILKRRAGWPRHNLPVTVPLQPDGAGHHG
jgi:hypothetical protein